MGLPGDVAQRNEVGVPVIVEAEARCGPGKPSNEVERASEGRRLRGAQARQEHHRDVKWGL